MRIFEGIVHYAHAGGGDVEPLLGEMTGSSRLRIGNYRVLFFIDAGKMHIFTVRHRSEAY